MANAPTPFRSPDPGVRIDQLEARMTKIEKADRSDTMGRWVFRAVAAAVLAGVVSVLFATFIYWLREPAPKVTRSRTTPAQKERAADERACEALDGEYASRVGDDLVCSNVGLNRNVVIFKTTVRNGRKSVEIIRR